MAAHDREGAVVGVTPNAHITADGGYTPFGWKEAP
jgi:hypothetical protein